MEILQTLERGLLALEQIAEHNGEFTVAQLAEKLQINRTIAYRLAWTLQQLGYVKLNERQALELTSKVMGLSQCYEKTIPVMTQEVLNRLAQKTQGSAALVIAEENECVVVKSASSKAQYLKVNYQVGSRHPIGVSAAGLAIAMSYPIQADESEEIKEARTRGYGYSEGKLQTGARGYFVPIPHRHMAIGVIILHTPQEQEILNALQDAVAALA